MFYLFAEGPILFERIMIEMDLMQRMTNKTKEKRILKKQSPVGCTIKVLGS
jgi:hypothetical protein